MWTGHAGPGAVTFLAPPTFVLQHELSLVLPTQVQEEWGSESKEILI